MSATLMIIFNDSHLDLPVPQIHTYINFCFQVLAIQIIRKNTRRLSE